jgi:hypothetical protein
VRPFLKFTREGKQGIDFLFGEQRHEVAIGTGNSVDVLARVESDLRRHDREEQVPARAEITDADPLALQVTDGSDGLIRERLETSGM